MMNYIYCLLEQYWLQSDDKIIAWKKTPLQWKWKYGNLMNSWLKNDFLELNQNLILIAES